MLLVIQSLVEILLVVCLENWLEDDVLLKIAQENAVAETAFS